MSEAESPDTAALPFNRWWRVAYALAAVGFALVYFRPPVNAPGAPLERLTALTAPTPYQYRVLLPLLVRWATAVVPLSVPVAYCVAMAIVAFGLFLAFERYLTYFMPATAAHAGALALLYPLVWNYCAVSGLQYPWDIPAILFFVLGLACLLRQQWRAYYVVFVLASLNRETSIFLALAYLCTQWGRQDRLRLAVNVAAQGAIWFVFKTALTYRFRANPGEKVFEPHLLSNYHFLLSLLQDPLDNALVLFLTFGWMVLALALTWRHQPGFLKRLLLLVPPFLVGMAFVGDFGQVRIHNELVPILLAPTLVGIYKWRQRSLEHLAE